MPETIEAPMHVVECPTWCILRDSHAPDDVDEEGALWIHRSAATSSHHYLCSTSEEHGPATRPMIYDGGHNARSLQRTEQMAYELLALVATARAAVTA